MNPIHENIHESWRELQKSQAWIAESIERQRYLFFYLFIYKCTLSSFIKQNNEEQTNLL